MSHNEDDYRGYLGFDERFSAMPIHQTDTYLSETEQKCAIVVMWSSQDSTWQGWWWGYEWQLVPWLSAQHSHDLPWVYLNATHTVTWSPGSERFHIKDKWFSWYVEMTACRLKKMTFILIFCPNFSCIWRENSSSVMENTFQCRLIDQNIIKNGFRNGCFRPNYYPPLQ